MQSHPLKPANAQRQQRPFVLKASELPLDGTAVTRSCCVGSVVRRPLSNARRRTERLDAARPADLDVFVLARPDRPSGKIAQS